MDDVPVDPSLFLSLFFFVFSLALTLLCARLCARVPVCVWWQRKRGDSQPRSSSSSSSSSQSHHLPTFPDPLACMQEHVALFCGLVLSAVLCCDILNCSVLCCAVPRYATWKKKKKQNALLSPSLYPLQRLTLLLCHWWVKISFSPWVYRKCQY